MSDDVFDVDDMFAVYADKETHSALAFVVDTKGDGTPANTSQESEVFDVEDGETDEREEGEIVVVEDDDVAIVEQRTGASPESLPSASYTHGDGIALLAHGGQVEKGVDENECPQPKRYKSTCFNCGEEGHSVKDCSLPRDGERISKNTRAHRRQRAEDGNRSSRYHAEDDPRFAALKAGHLTDDLREALGLAPNELPPWIYAMRVMGYPPGYLQRALVTDSGISFLTHTPSAPVGREEMAPRFFDELVPNWPGFNVRLQAGTMDTMWPLPFQPHWLKEYFFASPAQTTSGGHRKRAADGGTDEDASPSKRARVRNGSADDDEVMVVDDVDDGQCSEENSDEPVIIPLEPVDEPAPLALLRRKVATWADDEQTDDDVVVLNSRDGDTSVAEGRAGSDDDECLIDDEKTPEMTTPPKGKIVRDFTNSVVVHMGTPSLKSMSPATPLTPSLESFRQGIQEFVAHDEDHPAAGAGYARLSTMLAKVRRTKVPNGRK